MDRNPKDNSLHRTQSTSFSCAPHTPYFLPPSSPPHPSSTLHHPPQPFSTCLLPTPSIFHPSPLSPPLSSLLPSPYPHLQSPCPSPPPSPHPPSSILLLSPHHISSSHTPNSSTLLLTSSPHPSTPPCPTPPSHSPVSQSIPVYPGTHAQRYPRGKMADSSHVPPLIHVADVAQRFSPEIQHVTLDACVAMRPSCVRPPPLRYVYVNQHDVITCDVAPTDTKGTSIGGLKPKEPGSACRLFPLTSYRLFHCFSVDTTF